MVNKVIPCLRVDSLLDYNNITKAAANVVARLAGLRIRKKKKEQAEPWWKKRIQLKINQLRKDLNRIEKIKSGELKKDRVGDSLKEKYHIRKKGINCVIEELKQRITANSEKIKRYQKRCKQYQQNRLFQNNQKKLFEQLEGVERGNDESPEAEPTATFWKGIWEKDVKHNDEAEWIKEVDSEVERMSTKQNDLTITTEMLRKQSKKLSNWKSPGPDGVQGYWIKHLTTLHERLAALFNDGLSSGNVPNWLTKGKTVLIMKDKTKGKEVTNYRPITCLSLTGKLLTGILSEEIYNHLDSNNMLPEEQKGCRKRSRGTKDQLLIDKTIIKNCKRRKCGLAMGWIDYKKAFDMIPHSWILRCLDIFKVADNIKELMRQSMLNWETELTSGNEKLGSVKIKRGIFQGDSLSPLLFIIALIPPLIGTAKG